MHTFKHAVSTSNLSRIIAAAAVLATLLSGCTSNPSGNNAFSNNPNDYANVGSLRRPLGNGYNELNLPQNVSRVVYYRTGNNVIANQGQTSTSVSESGITTVTTTSTAPTVAASNGTFRNAATVYLNGDYHASLIPGSYSDVCVAPGASKLGVRMVDVRGQVKDGWDSVIPADLKGGQTTYVRVIEQGTQATLEPVSQAVALQELTGTRLQRHTISRVSTAIPCNGDPSTTSIFDLRADALFAFGRSDLASMTREGRQSLNDMIQKIRDKYVTVRQINLVGHTDPFGSVAANQQLSQARANTVRDYLQNNGLQDIKINAEGRGASQLVKTDCSKTQSAEAITCNQPNRRVSVEVQGAGR